MSPTFSLPYKGARRTAAGDAAWCHFAARECTVLPWGYTPHFLFETSKRKRAVHGGKEKMSGMSWPLCRSTHPKTEVGRHALPTKLETPLPAALYSNLKTVRPPHQKVLRTQVLQIGRPLLLFPLSLPRLSLGGVSKGESTKAPPGADKARCFRGNGTIGGPLGPGIVSP